MAAKAFGPVWGLFYPLHHDACVVRVLSITTLRYSSVMIQVPHWTPLSYTFAIFGSKCGILRPCPLLPSGAPSLVPVVVVSWFVALWFLPFLHAISPVLT